MNDIYVFVEHFQGAVADITYMCLAQAQDIARASGCKVKAVLLGQNPGALSGDLLADEVIAVDHPSLANFAYDEFVHILSAMLQEKKPALVLFGDTAIGSDLAGGLSARLSLPMVSFCKEIKPDDGKLSFISQICGGKILAEGELPEGTTLVTLLPGKFKPAEGKAQASPAIASYAPPDLPKPRVVVKEVILPTGEDVDISKEAILVGVGRGIENEDNIPIAQDLADALGGVLCASRPVVDQGWLSTSRLVGKSGKTIKPKLYLALGISGAPEHMEGLQDSELTIAVNTDPNAPIFNAAQYGTTEDLLDFAEELTRAVKAAKGG